MNQHIRNLKEGETAGKAMAVGSQSLPRQQDEQTTQRCIECGTPGCNAREMLANPNQGPQEMPGMAKPPHGNRRRRFWVKPPPRDIIGIEITDQNLSDGIKAVQIDS